MSSTVVQPTAAARTRLRPFGVAEVTLGGGFWDQRVRMNRSLTIPHGLSQLRQAGTLDNLRMAAGAPGTYAAGADSVGAILPFLDSDVYKWLEAVGWSADPALVAAAGEAIDVVTAAQRADGYLNSYVQVVGGGVPYDDLSWGHEFYCVGHLIQAAVAWHRALGDDRLLRVASRAVEHIHASFGPERRPGIDGHPGIEMALVELTRVTGDRRHLALAARMLDQRGHGTLPGADRFGATYWQDHQPVRSAPVVAGHAVRQLYLDCGAVDVAVELGDDELLEAVRRRWDDLMHTRTYLTGGMGSRHRDEAFGDPYELPPDRAYAETCAAIASVMLAWRLLLATGDPAYADALERAVYNGVLSGISLSGDRFYYTNPLQRRTHRAADGEGDRRPWYRCACCPPNLMRLFASWQQYLATHDDTGVQLHQYASAEIAAGPTSLSVETDYPWHGRVTVTVRDTPAQPWTLSMRIPQWCRSATLTSPDGTEILATGSGTVRRHGRWHPGDTVTLTLDLPIRVTEPDPRIDAVRGCVAFERGPLVYCFESAEAPPRTELEELAWDPSRHPIETRRPETADPMIGLAVPVTRRRPEPQALTAGAIPYFAWANGGAGGMRVWLPR